MYNTSDALPREDGDRRKRILSRFRLRRSSGDGVATSPVPTELSSRLSEVRFAKPGEMYRKYAPDSPWVRDPIAKELFKGATAVGSTDKGVNQQGSVVPRSRSARLSTRTPRSNIKLRKGAGDMVPPDTKLGKRLSPVRERMLHSYITSNYSGEHTDFLKKRADILDRHKAEYHAVANGTPEQISTLRERHKSELQAHDRPYYAEVRRRNGIGMELDGIRRNIRRSAAEDLGTRRKVLQGLRQHASGTLPPPLPSEQMDRIKSRAKRIKTSRVGQHSRLVKTGIAENHGKNAPLKIGGKEAPELTTAIKEGVDKLNASTGAVIEHRKLLTQKMHSALIDRAMRNIAKQRSASVDEGAKYLRKHKRGTLESQAASTVHQAIYSPRAPEGVQKDTLAEQLGMSGDRIDRLRERYRRFQYPDQKVHDRIQSGILKRGDIFKEAEAAVSPRTGYPALKKLGKGAAIGAGALAAAVLVRKAMKRKDRNFSSKSRPIQFSALDHIRRALRSDSAKRRVAVGLALTGGISAADAATSATYPDPDKSRTQSAISGAKRGALYGGVLATAEPLLYRPIRKAMKSFRYNAKDRVIYFKQDDDFKRDVAVGTIEGGAGVLATDRLIRRFAPEGSPLRRKLLIGGVVGGIATGTIGYALNRAIKKRQQQMSSKLKEVRFQISRSGRAVMHDGIKIDVKKLVDRIGDRADRAVPIDRLKSMPMTRKSGFSERRVERCNIYKPTIVTPSNEVVDGRHRIVRKKRMGRTHVQAIKATKKDLRAVQMMSVPISQLTQFATVAVTQDRYRKAIHEREQERMESNLGRSAVAGAIVAAAVRKHLGTKLGKSLAVGGALGLGTEAAVLHSTRGSRDQFGERSYRAKRAEKLPWQVGGLTAAGIGIRKARRFLSARGSEIRFAMTPEERDRRRFQRRWAEDRLPRRAEELYQRLGRGRRVIRDVAAEAEGDPNLDPRGRERTPEWKKPWAKKAIGAGILLVALKHRALASKVADTALGKAVRSGARKVGERVPIIKKAATSTRDFYRDIKGEYHDLMKSSEAEAKPTVVSEREAREDLKRRRSAIRHSVERGDPLNMSAIFPEIRFAETVPSWDIRDQRGRSARVFAPGSQRRTRRAKKWHEKKANRDVLWGALAAGALGTGAGGVTIIKKNAERAAGKAEAAAKIIRPNMSATASIFRRFRPGGLHGLSSRLDDVILFAAPKKNDHKAAWAASAGAIGGGVIGSQAGFGSGLAHKRVMESIVEKIQDVQRHSERETFGGMPTMDSDKPFSKGIFDAEERLARLRHQKGNAAGKFLKRRTLKWGLVGAGVGALSGYAQQKSGLHKTRE